MINLHLKFFVPELIPMQGTFEYINYQYNRVCKCHCSVFNLIILN
jgi:hypothetical protein